MFTFLRSLFVVHDWDWSDGAEVRHCKLCGRREALDIYDGATLNAWYEVWKGYPRAHFAKKASLPPEHGGSSKPATGIRNAIARVKDPGLHSKR